MKCDTCKWRTHIDGRNGYVYCGGWKVNVANNRRVETREGSRYGQPLADFVDCSNYVMEVR